MKDEFECSRARKYAKWWSQCFLTGIERILLGFRDEYGVVRQIQPLLVKDIETRAVSCLIFLSCSDQKIFLLANMEFEFIPCFSQ